MISMILQFGHNIVELIMLIEHTQNILLANLNFNNLYYLILQNFKFSSINFRNIFENKNNNLIL